MKRVLTFFALFALVASVAASANAAPVRQARAKLVSIHKIKAAPPLPGKPVRRANCSNDGATDASDYLTIGARVAGPRTAYLNAATVPSGLNLTETMTALEFGFDVWTGVPAIDVATGGVVTKQTANHQTDVLWGRTGGSLATTYTWKWSTGEYESDVVFDKSYAWANLGDEGDGCYEDAGNVYDVGNIATHEFGHLYGLNHPSEGRYETMYSYGYSGETLKRSPGAGDVAGMGTLYN